MSFTKNLSCSLFVFLCIPAIGKSQNLYFTNSDSLTMSGNAQIILNNTSTSNRTFLKNNKYFQCNNSSVVDIISYGLASIGGTSLPTFKNLTVDLKSTDPTNPNILTLNQSIVVNGDLSFASDGLIELNSFGINFGNNANGQIVNETNTARITGINGGKIIKTVNMSAPNSRVNVNFGNLGIIISTNGANGNTTTAGDLGNVTVTRGHTLQKNTAGTGFAGVYRYFDVKPTSNPAGNNITVKFTYFDAEVTKAPVDYTNAKDQLTLWNSQESTRGIWLLTDRDSYDATNNWVLKSGIPTLTTASGVNYRFTLSSTTTKPLPVQLINFTGNWNSGNADLVWKVSNDGSLHHFELEHSQDGISFSKLSDILSIPSAITEQHYAYTDQHPYTPISYYRLKVVDNTQKYFYSNVIKLKAGGELTASIYPNPAQDHTYLSFSSLTDGNTTIQLFNAAGQLVRAQTISFHKGDNIIDISLNNLPKGMYAVKSADILIDHNMLIKN